MNEKIAKAKDRRRSPDGRDRRRLDGLFYPTNHHLDDSPLDLEDSSNLVIAKESMVKCVGTLPTPRFSCLLTIF